MSTINILEGSKFRKLLSSLPLPISGEDTYLDLTCLKTMTYLLPMCSLALRIRDSCPHCRQDLPLCPSMILTRTFGVMLAQVAQSKQGGYHPVPDPGEVSIIPFWLLFPHKLNHTGKPGKFMLPLNRNSLLHNTGHFHPVNIWNNSAQLLLHLNYPCLGHTLHRAVPATFLLLFQESWGTSASPWNPWDSPQPGATQEQGFGANLPCTGRSSPKAVSRPCCSPCSRRKTIWISQFTNGAGIPGQPGFHWLSLCFLSNRPSCCQLPYDLLPL